MKMSLSAFAHFTLQNIRRSVTCSCRNRQFKRLFSNNNTTDETALPVVEDNEEKEEPPTRKLPPIYTKTGDKGITSLFTGERRPKYDAVFDALGDVDELTSHLGMVKENIADSWQVENFKEIDDMLEKLQCTLQDLNSSIATPIDSASEKHKERTGFDGELITELEEMIDKYSEELPPLKNFILPSGGRTASSLHIARAVCRRAERKVATLYSSNSVPDTTYKYINRLSDYLFTIARYTAMMEGRKEVIYKRPKPWRKEKEENTDNNEAKNNKES